MKTATLKQLVCFDFGYTTLGETECVALACVLRVTAEVQAEDFPVLHLDGDDDLAAHCKTVTYTAHANQKALQIGGPFIISTRTCSACLATSHVSRPNRNNNHHGYTHERRT